MAKQKVGFIQDIIALIAAISAIIKELRELGIFGANINTVKSMGATAKRTGKKAKLVALHKSLQAKLKAAKKVRVKK